MLSIQLADTLSTLSEERCVLFGAVGRHIFVQIYLILVPPGLTLSPPLTSPAFVCYV